MKGDRRKIFAGRYAYDKPLGRGAGGAVYLCEDVEVPGRQVAVKVLSAEAFATVQGKMLKREFEILSKLDHPNLVRVYDYGSLPDGGVFLAEEYIDGFSLQDARALIQPEGMIDITLQLLHGLSYLHGMGMIHRDIKPANVMLLWLDDASARPMAKLVDFGLSSADPKKDTLRGGTRSYMAPEIIRGEKGEFQSDLYSLGVTLYYTMCGVLPFGPRTKEDPPTNEEDFRPPDPHRLNPDVPLNLSRFTMVLLRQVADLIYMDAGEALQALAADSGAFEWVTTGQLANNLDIAAPPVLRGYFERGILQEETAICERVVDSLALETRGRLRLVRGKSGIGKSRLLHEVAAAVKLAGLVVVDIACHPGMMRFEMALAMLGAMTDLAEGRGLAIGERLRPNVTLLSRLAEWLGSSQENDDTSDGMWIRESLEDMIVMMQPDRIVFFVEDGHHADTATLDLLKKWYDGGTGFQRPSMVLAAEPEARIDALSRASDCDIIELHGLREADVAYFFQTRLGVAQLPEDWMATVAGNANGDPSYVEELSRHLIDSGILSRQSSIQWLVSREDLVGFSLPRSKKESLRRRLSGFGHAGRELLEILAVMDRPVEWSTLRKIALTQGGEAHEVDRNIEMLRWRQFIHLDLDENGRHLRLIDRDLRDVILAPMNAEWRRSISRRVAERLERNWKRGQGSVLEIARHMEAAGHDRAAVWLEMAGDNRSSKELAFAAEHWGRAAAKQMGAEKAQTLLKLAEASLRLNKIDVARTSVEDAWDIAERTTLDWLMFRVCMVGADLGFAQGTLNVVELWIERLRDVLPVHGQQPWVRLTEARMMVSQGRLAEAEKRLTSCLAQFEHFGNVSGEVIVRSYLARIRFWRDELDAAGRLFEEAVSVARDDAANDGLAVALIGRGAFLRVTGEFDAARRTLAEAFDVSTNFGAPELCVEALLELGETHMMCGELDAAKARGMEARRLADGLGHIPLWCGAELLVSELAVREVEGVDEALARMEAAVERLASNGSARPRHAEGLARLGRALYKAGQKERSREVTAAGQQLAREIGMALSHLG